MSPWVVARCLKQRISDYLNQSQKWLVTDPCGDLFWQAPRSGFIKINVDGACDSNSGRAGIGICGRDEFGVVWVAEAQWAEKVPSSRDAEELALLKAMEWAAERHIQKACFETDCAIVFEMVLQGVGYEYS
ncbi:hypothetical protein QQ045_016666 [Rhodiola kirilowii]